LTVLLDESEFWCCLVSIVFLNVELSRIRKKLEVLWGSLKRLRGCLKGVAYERRRIKAWDLALDAVYFLAVLYSFFGRGVEGFELLALIINYYFKYLVMRSIGRQLRSWLSLMEYHHKALNDQLLSSGYRPRLCLLHSKHLDLAEKLNQVYSPSLLAKLTVDFLLLIVSANYVVTAGTPSLLVTLSDVVWLLPHLYDPYTIVASCTAFVKVVSPLKYRFVN
jgi:hypothetical protein